MPDLVINTGPIIALTAAAGSLKFLDHLYNDILIPYEVVRELEVAGTNCPELVAISESAALRTLSDPVELPRLLRSQLDAGEASVIQNALNHQVGIVAIDETLGRRIARLHELRVTGSVGILVKAAKAGRITDLTECFNRMSQKGVWISHQLIEQALLSVKA